ncbi:MAG: hypothetical protein A2931_01250 [Candidatus Niyogibacteria bacterium RIFCSPLOWO2_01_FULL_45_48]|uniref:Antitoxin n=1 Tax=Candidatus Niyogibacteria bacterium RIFCSPLOWO2_01_FULL_45_48 TaxID=1801724 RepID=A0A1G2EWB5_9BACT|nr:MAG: hypothetical protein A2931_01250 [Candidatus Niyogibacteria bacterium RIFCSPLOWO2_01_FULL_45_48]
MFGEKISQSKTLPSRAEDDEIGHALTPYLKETKTRFNLARFYDNFQYLTKVYLKINFVYMNKLIGLKELRKNADVYISEVEKGKSFIVVKRSKPVFKITPPDEDDGAWETVVNFTDFYKDGISAKQLLKRIGSL